MRRVQRQNGKRPLILYLAGVVQGLLLLAGTYWTGRVEGISESLSQHERHSQEVIISFESRIAKLEGQMQLLTLQASEATIKLDRIEEEILHGKEPKP